MKIWCLRKFSDNLDFLLLYITMPSKNVKCFFKCIPIQRGAVTVGILEIMMALLNITFILTTNEMRETDGLQCTDYYAIAWTIISIAIVALMFIGVGKKLHHYVIPHLIFQIVFIIIMILVEFSVFLIVIVVGSIFDDDDDVEWGLLIFILVYVLLCTIFEIRMFPVILQLYHCYHNQRNKSFPITAVPYSHQNPAQALDIKSKVP